MNTLTYMMPLSSYYNPLNWAWQGSLFVLILELKNVYIGVTHLLNDRVDFPIINQFIPINYRKRRYTRGWLAHERMFRTSVIREMKVKPRWDAVWTQWDRPWFEKLTAGDEAVEKPKAVTLWVSMGNGSTTLQSKSAVPGRANWN